MANKIIPISYFKPQLMRKENRYAPGWTPKDTDFYTEMFAIRDGVYFTEVQAIREEDDHDKRQEIKGKSLNALTISAKIDKHRKADNCTHSGLLNIDIDPKDNPEIDNWEEVRDMLFEMPEVVSSFLSASAQGVTLVFKIDPSKHKDTFFSIKDDLYDNFNIIIDKGTHDICRLRYVSFDPRIKIREDFDAIPNSVPSASYLANKNQKRSSVTTYDNITDKDGDETFNKAIEKAQSKLGPFSDGVKHYFLATLAGYCNTIGMSQSVCEDKVSSAFGAISGLDSDLLLRPVRNVYRTYSGQHNSAAEKNISSRLNDKITNTIVKQFVRVGADPREEDLVRVAEELEANLDRVKEVAERVIDEYSEELNQDFLNTPAQVIGKKLKLVQFWIIDEDDKITLDKRMFKEFLVNNGVFRYRIKIDKWILIRIDDNIVREISKADLKKVVTDYLESIKRFDIYQFIAQNVTKTFSDDWLELLPEADIDFKKDEKKNVNVFFKNGFLSITPDGYSLKPYNELTGYIWDSQILNRNYIAPSEELNDDFRKFVYNVSGGGQADATHIELEKAEKRYASICSALGYLLHDYKDSSCNPAVIFNDEVISENPEGGTGKGILIHAVRHFKKTVVLDGKTFSFDKSFVYQRVDLDTKLIAFDDVNKNFDFERLFSVITEGLEVEKKNKGTFYMEFKDSPKIVLTTNYAIKGDGNSHDRRKFEIELAQYYTKKFAPNDDFGRRLFDDWNEGEWYMFDTFMADCASLYLRAGLVQQELVHLPEKRLINGTSQEFYDFMNEWMDEHSGKPTGDFKKSIMFTAFLSENETFKKWLSSKRFCAWVRDYFNFKDVKFEETRTADSKIFRIQGVF